ncbi:MAG: PAS domain S-box protein, partial [Chitinophagales bacterium]|nr:PAS domain S-box protein [Chitinophagales bacterium]
MANVSLTGWFKNISIARKLYFAVGIMAVLIAFELITLWFAVSTLSSVRAFVGAEGLWSKGQKDAAYNLRKYGLKRNEHDYMLFQQFMQVPLGDHKTRMELPKARPDMAIARQGFIEGRNHPDDVDGMIKLFTRFYKIYYIEKAINIWGAADEMIRPLIPLGEEIRKEVNSPNPSAEKIDLLLQQLDDVNEKLTALEDDFSFTLGEGSRWLENLVLKLLFAVALTVEISGLLLTISVSRQIQKGLDEILRASRLVGKGDFKARAAIYSGDEIGVLAQSFNQMAEDLGGSEEQIQTIFKNAPDAVIVIDKTGRVERWNPKAEEMFGWQLSEVLGKHLHETIIPHQHRVAHQRGLKRYFETGNGPVLNRTIEMTALKKTGEEFDVQLSISATTVKGQQLFIGFLSDATERKKASKDLKDYARKLEQSNNNLEQFAYVASHDLQEPLRTITNFTTLLEERQKEHLDTTSKKYMQYVVTAAERMKRLIRDMLLFSRLGKQQVLEPVNLNEVMIELLLDMDLLIKETNTQITTTGLPTLHTGKTEIKLLLQNLINNAIKYSKAGIPPQIEVRAEKQKNNDWLFAVKDNGIGIDPEFNDKIFIIFQRLHSEKEYSGTGIG